MSTESGYVLKSELSKQENDEDFLRPWNGSIETTNFSMIISVIPIEVGEIMILDHSYRFIMLNFIQKLTDEIGICFYKCSWIYCDGEISIIIKLKRRY